MAGLPCIAAIVIFIRTLNLTILNTTLSAIAAIISYTLTVAMLIPENYYCCFSSNIHASESNSNNLIKKSVNLSRAALPQYRRKL